MTPSDSLLYGLICRSSLSDQPIVVHRALRALLLAESASTARRCREKRQPCSLNSLVSLRNSSHRPQPVIRAVSLSFALQDRTLREYALTNRPRHAYSFRNSVPVLSTCGNAGG